MSKSDNTDKLSDLFSNYNPAYSEGFAERVMKGIEAENKSKDKIDVEFYKVFKLVALSGMAAIILLLFTIYITDGSFSTDGFYGLLNYTPDEPLLTSLNL